MALTTEGTPLDFDDSHNPPVCSICEEPYDEDMHEATFLTCHHTFCFYCLVLIANGLPENNLGETECPTCHKLTELPEGGVSGLQTNQQIKNICPLHSNQLMSFFCETCTKAICQDCVVLDHDTDAGHVITNVADVEDSHRQALLDQLNERHTTLMQIQGNMKRVEQQMALLEAAQEITKKEVEEFIQYAHWNLEERKRELIENTEHLYNAKQNILLDKQKHIQEAMDNLSHSITETEQLVENGNLNKIINTTQNLMTSAEGIQPNFDELDLGRNYISLDSNEGEVAFLKCLNHLGVIDIKGVLPTNIHIEAKEARVGQKAKLKVELFSDHDETIPLMAGHLTAEIRDPENSEIENIVDMTDNGYTVTFIPQMSGLHKVSTLFLGQQLTLEQTNISVSSNNPVLTFGKQGRGNGTFQTPWTIAIDKDGYVYVCDSGNKWIQKFTADGDFICQFNPALINGDSFTVDITMDLQKAHLFWMELLNEKECIVNERNIHVFDLNNGELKCTYSLQNTLNSSFLVITKNGDVVLADRARKCLTKVNTEGRILCYMGHSLGLPSIAFMCINGDDDSIIAVDRGDSSINIFDDQASFIHKFGSVGTGKGQLQGPWGVATDGEYILVSEAGNQRIQVFKMDGTFVSMIESHDDPILQPRGLAVSNDGHVYVADQGSHCVKKYKYRDMPG